MSQVALTFPDSTYSSSNKPSVATLKADLTAIETAHNDTDTNSVTLTGTQVLTNKTLTSPTINTPTLVGGTIRSQLYAPQGFLINGKISVTDSGSGLVVALKTLAGTDPSATDPVYCRIGDTPRTISAALSVTKADGTNWFNAGGAELATKEIDYFVYLGYNATDGVVIGFSRIPSANQYSDFSATTTNEKYAAISTITTAASTDYYEVIGRFAATLSAGAGYTWSVPTFTAINLIQRPIYDTRKLSFLPTYSASGSMTYTSVTTTEASYKISGSGAWVFFDNSGTTGGTANNEIKMTLPFSAGASNAASNGSTTDTAFTIGFGYASTSTLSVRKSDSSNFGLGASRGCRQTIIYEI